MFDVYERLSCLQKKIYEVQCRLFSVNVSFFKTNKKNFEPNVEHVVTYSSSTSWETFSFFIKKVMYRMKSVSDGIKDMVNDLNEKVVDDCKIFIPFAQCYEHIFYDFEDMVIAFSRLYESDMIDEICRFLNNNLKKKMVDNLPKKNDVNGLYWRINLLRNRLAHSTSGRYDNRNKAKRYLDFLSMVKMVTVEGNNIEAKCTLIDLEKNQFIKQIIQDYIIDKRYGKELSESNVFDLIFPEKRPRGHGKDKPLVLMIENIEFFDYFSSFFSLAHQIIEYINNQMLVFMISGYCDCAEGVERQQWKYSNEKILTINDVYDIDNQVWK